MGYAQELSRSMSKFSNFAISFSIICILSGGINSFGQSIGSVGGAGAGFGWIVGCLISGMFALAMAQIASAFPTAGGLYHWASILGNRFWGWLTAWLNLLGLLTVLGAINIGTAFFFQATFGNRLFEMGTDATSIVVFVAIITVIQAIFNHVGIKVTTFLTDISGYIILVTTAVLVIACLYFAPALDFSRLWTFTNNFGAAGGNVFPDPSVTEQNPAGNGASMLYVFVLGLLLPLYTITGYDASAHTAEETKNARDTVHKGMLHSVFWSLVFGFVMIVAMIMAIPDLTAAAASGWASFNDVFIAAILGSTLGKAMLLGIIVSNFLCALAAVTSTSRMIYAFARDDGLPFSGLLKSVSATYRTPVAAIWMTAILCSILTALTTPLNAFAALSTGSAMYLYISYAMPILAGALALGKTWTTKGSFTLGGLYTVFALIVALGTVAIIIAGHAFVISIPGDAAAGTSFVPGLWYYSAAFLIFLAVLWFGIENRRFKGPPIGDEVRKRAAAIAAAERAVGERG
jgi:amino acid transporter